jgi:3-phenylpropionate/cinnamic acid dioxygenase small subunit
MTSADTTGASGAGATLGDPPAITHEAIEAFLYREARLADEHRYAEWEALWTDDALYWVPAHSGPPTDSATATDTEPVRRVSIIYDNRRRIATRIRQLTSGDRYAQRPPSQLRRLVSNIEVLAADATHAEVAANVLVVEVRLGETELWASRTTYGLCVEDGALRLARKEVRLVGGDGDLPTLAFLI